MGGTATYKFQHGPKTSNFRTPAVRTLPNSTHTRNRPRFRGHQGKKEKQTAFTKAATRNREKIGEERPGWCSEYTSFKFRAKGPELRVCSVESLSFPSRCWLCSFCFLGLAWAFELEVANREKPAGMGLRYFCYDKKKRSGAPRPGRE